MLTLTLIHRKTLSSFLAEIELHCDPTVDYNMETFNILVIDTETTGLPRREAGKAMHELPVNAWPYPVQLSAVLYDAATRDISDHFDSVIALPSNIVVPACSSAVHGITADECRRSGARVTEALRDIGSLARRADVIVGHNLEFDLGVVTAAAHRSDCYADLPACLDVDPKRSTKPRVCTMIEGLPLCQLPFPRDRPGRSNNYKYPKLGELCAHLFGSEPDGLHDSFVDVLVCLRCHVYMWSGIDLFKSAGTYLRSVHQDLGLVNGDDSTPCNSHTADPALE